MAHPLLSKRRTKAISTALFLIGLAVIFLTKTAWPEILLVLGIPLALKQYLLGRRKEMVLSLVVFVGFFVVAQFNISWRILVPILFVMAALYILCKEWVDDSTESEIEATEDLNKEIEENTPPKSRH